MENLESVWERERPLQLEWESAATGAEKRKKALKTLVITWYIYFCTHFKSVLAVLIAIVEDHRMILNSLPTYLLRFGVLG